MNEENSDKNKMNLLETYQSSNILETLQRPNTQFIRQAAQLNFRAKELINIFEKLKENLNIVFSSASLRTGAGFLINSTNFNFVEDKVENVVEVIDFDPIRNNMMVVGNIEPINESTIHWFLYRGLKDINGILIINDDEVFEIFKNRSFIELEYNDGMLNTDLSLRILKAAKDSKITILNGSIISGILITGKTLNEAYNLLETNLKQTR